MISNGSFDSYSSSSKRKDGIYTYFKILPTPFEVETDKEVYSFRFNSVAVNDKDTTDVGLWLLVLKNENGEK